METTLDDKLKDLQELLDALDSGVENTQNAEWRSIPGN